jgi:biotin transport system ATP-binding protein
MPLPAPGITLAQACVTLAGKGILTGITATLSEQRIGLMGRDGSGKTTLLRVIAGLIAPTTGIFRLRGIDPFRDRKATPGA